MSLLSIFGSKYHLENLASPTHKKRCDQVTQVFWFIHNPQCRKCHAEELLPFGVVVWQENEYKKYIYTGINDYYPDTPRERGAAW